MDGPVLQIGVICFILHGMVSGVPPEYLQKRKHIIDTEERQRLGGTLVLNAKEQKVNAVLMAAKRKEIELSRDTGKIFPPAISFFQAKKLIDHSAVFSIIKRMPKGGALHTHDSSITSLDWLVTNVTYRPHCYMCYTESGDVMFYFYAKPPTNTDCHWKTVASQRQASGDADRFDQQLVRNISIIVDDPSSAYPTVDAVWKKFVKYFQAVNGLLNHAPVFRDYWRQALEEFRHDNVQYLEVRALLPTTYELDGTHHGAEWALNTYRNVTREFVAEHPDFIGAKLIHSAVKFINKQAMLPNVKEAMVFLKKYPDFYKGFDLVGQEGLGKTLLYYLDDLLYPSQQNPPVYLPYFFHAGETDWEETQVDDNLVDAILLNTSRIGHGFAIHKHPQVMKIIKQRDIAVEVNPISNQVLGLVKDLRNHAAVLLIAENYPLVISSDDPAVWEATPLSHDFYEAFMGMTGEQTDLTFLKQLAINSIKYSAMNQQEKQAAMKLWQRKWDMFIDATVHQHYYIHIPGIMG
ncbi:adenosine deaminase AGSA-like [Gigantopelta aegis]|uniref:adenosine deaminase AGSA-like n=1 Tax=Gigantopelta aegis TaxID=1735272 RepID=UPI001B88801D|nr:adenosine deaminase AGSA-like [Gigantopelta aegis]XP_041366012.1 adenosine deaminase AGSA-like [Gigantopelta aegis]